MESFQSAVLARIADLAVAHGLQPVQAQKWANSGTVAFLTPDGETWRTLDYDFQDDRFTLTAYGREFGATIRAARGIPNALAWVRLALNLEAPR